MFETMIRNLSDEELITWAEDSVAVMDLSFSDAAALIKELAQRLQTSIN